MLPFTQSLRKSLELLANSEIALQQKKYMRDKFDFLGVKSPERKLVLKAFLKQVSMPKNIWEQIQDLWQQDEREFQYCAVEILLQYANKKMDEKDIVELEKLILDKSWWDSVDALSAVVGKYFLQYPEKKQSVTEKWLDSNQIWLIRMAIIFQLAYKHKTDKDLLFDNILKAASHKDFFVRKAIGWALRQYARVEAQEVIDFVENNRPILSSLSIKEALKHLN